MIRKGMKIIELNNIKDITMYQKTLKSSATLLKQRGWLFLRPFLAPLSKITKFRRLWFVIH